MPAELIDKSHGWFRNWFRKVWRLRGGGLYACGFAITFVVLEIGSLADDVVLVGSHNYTGAALDDNHEASVLLVDAELHEVKPEIEIRFLLQRDTGSLFLVQRDRVSWLRRLPGTGDGTGAVESIGSVGVRPPLEPWSVVVQLEGLEDQIRVNQLAGVSGLAEPIA